MGLQTSRNAAGQSSSQPYGRDTDVLFVGLARDCAATLPAFLAFAERARAAGLAVSSLIGEDGSRDATHEILTSAAARGGLTVMDTSAMAKLSDRLDRMALGRELLLQRVKAVANSVRAVCVIDLDEPFFEGLEVDTFRLSLNRLHERKDIFAAAATSRPTYYDLLAYEDDRRSFAELEFELARRRSRPLAYYAYFRDVVYPAQASLTEGADIMCVSAFNGLAIYDCDAYVSGSYRRKLVDPPICEHITLNRSIAARSGLRMMIDGGLILPAPKEHVKRGPVGFFAQRMFSLTAAGARRVQPCAQGRLRRHAGHPPSRRLSQRDC